MDEQRKHAILFVAKILRTIFGRRTHSDALGRHRCARPGQELQSNGECVVCKGLAVHDPRARPELGFGR